MLAATLAMAAPLLIADGEQGFLHMPHAEEFRFQKISRSGDEAGWPFAADEGQLACAWGMGKRLTYFVEDAETASEEGRSPRVAVLSVDPFELAFINIASRGLFPEGQTMESRIRLVAPFVATAQRLCDQPAGTHVGSGEL